MRVHGNLLELLCAVANKWRIDRTTVAHVCKVAKQGALNALDPASKTGTPPPSVAPSALTAARLASWAHAATRLRHRPPRRAVIAAFGNDTVLLVIDPQAGVLDLDHWGGHGSARSNPNAEHHIAVALTAFRDADLPVMFTQHCSREPDSPLRAGHPGHAFLPGLEPRAGETVVPKDVNSGYLGTRLEIELRRLGIRRIVHAGMFTNMCVATTVRMSGNLGFDSYLAHDATFCCDRQSPDGDVHPADLVQSVTVANLHGEFCTAIPTDAVVTLTQRDAAHLDRRQGNEPARHPR